MTPLAPAERSNRIPAPRARSWWPVPAMIALGLGAQHVLLDSRYDVGGHAAGHLASASAPFLAAALIGIVLWATPRARRQADVMVATAAWLATTIAVMLGNLRVVDQLVAAGHAHTPTESVPDVADHGLANAAPWYGVAAAVVFVVVLRARRHMGDRATIAAIVATLMIPPWIFPGAGVIVAALVRCVTRHREQAVNCPGRLAT